MKIINQVLNSQNIATPLITQWSGVLSQGNYTSRMKLVDWPVVERVPARFTVLYRGQLYWFPLKSLDVFGRKWMTGNS